MIQCEKCGNRMPMDKYNAHACKVDEKKTEKGMRIGVFVSPYRSDTSSMKLAAAEFRNARYMVRGMNAEEEFTKIAKEMKSEVFIVPTDKYPIDLVDAAIMKKSDLVIMFPSSKHYEGKEIMKFPLSVPDENNPTVAYKVPAIVYPER